MNKLTIKGIPASPGVAEGTAVIIKPGEDTSFFKVGDILVTIITDPTMVTTMTKASAIITDIGGITSHPAILSREMGIPCIVNTKNATIKLKTGMRIHVDGKKGEIYEMD